MTDSGPGQGHRSDRQRARRERWAPRPRDSRAIAGPLTKLVIFAVVTIGLTALLGQTLGSLGSGGGTRYRAWFTDVTGLLAGDDVRIAGVRVGRVERIGLAPGQRAVAEVAFTVDSNVPLAASVRAAVRYRNLVGQRYLALTEGASGAQRLGRDGLIPLSQTSAALDLTVVFNGFRPLLAGLNPDDLNRVMYEIVQVLQGEGGTVASLLGHLGSLTTALADRDAAVGRLITNLNAVLGTVAARDANLDQTVLRLQELVSGLAGDREAIGAAIGQIGDLASVTGSLLRDVRPDLAQDVTLLNQLAGTLNDNTQVIEETLHGLPDRYAELTTVASYGSWFNFYLCDFDGRVGLVPGVDDARPTFHAGAARCGGGR